MTQWHLYIIRCDNRFLYTGISTDVERRVAEHREGARKGAAYTRPFSSIALVYQVSVGDRSTAAKIEYRIKRLRKRDKEMIVSSRFDKDELMKFVGLPAPGAGASPDGD